MSPPSYLSWIPDDVASWVSKLNPVFAKYTEAFKAEVSGDMLPDLDDETLAELGVTSRLHRKRLLRAVEQLVAGEGTRDNEEDKEDTKDAPKSAVKKEEEKEGGEKVEEEEEEPTEKSGKKRASTSISLRLSKKAKHEGKEEDDGGGDNNDEKEKEEEEEEEGEPRRGEKAAEKVESLDASHISSVPDVSNGVEVCISFDTTGSMYPCLSQVRRDVQATVRRLLSDIPYIRIALVAHGDYGDEGKTYVIKTLNFTSDEQTLVDWVSDVGPTCGYDGDECYELVLRDVQKFAWSPMCRNRSLVLIGDSNPHPLHSNNPYNIDWRVEARKLRDMDVRVYAVHALGYGHSRDFYRTLADITNGTYLRLSQFSTVVNFVCGICYCRSDRTQLENYEREVRSRPGGSERAVRALFDALLNRDAGEDTVHPDGLRPVRGGRFQVLEVDVKTPIKTFAQSHGLVFKTGRGFYQFTKPEHISTKKEIVLVQKETGDMFTGEAAQALLGITAATSAGKVKIQPSALGEFDVFVQSTSWNRGLVAGTKFLYEVDEER